MQFFKLCFAMACFGIFIGGLARFIELFRPNEQNQDTRNPNAK